MDSGVSSQARISVRACFRLAIIVSGSTSPSKEIGYSIINLYRNEQLHENKLASKILVLHHKLKSPQII